ncbi:hypothetical protein TNCV_2542581 [Trichonephila clavipes]|nr:hypothetical protein TNCV_2542581 [Trichonephila clavipes]
MLIDDQIVTSVQEESDPVDDGTDEDEDNKNYESSKVPSNGPLYYGSSNEPRLNTTMPATSSPPIPLGSTAIL